MKPQIAILEHAAEHSYSYGNSQVQYASLDRVVANHPLWDMRLPLRWRISFVSTCDNDEHIPFQMLTHSRTIISIRIVRQIAGCNKNTPRRMLKTRNWVSLNNFPTHKYGSVDIIKEKCHQG